MCKRVKFRRAARLFRNQNKMKLEDSITLINLLSNKSMNSLMKIIRRVQEVLVWVLLIIFSQFYKIYKREINHMVPILFLDNKVLKIILQIADS